MGTRGWSYDRSDGLVYPPRPASGERLARYARTFPLVEIDSTNGARGAPVRRYTGAAVKTNEAMRFVVTGATVTTHIGRIFGELELRDRAAAVVYAYDHGPVRPSE